MLLLGKCALLGESQRRFGDSSCSLNGKSTVCVVEWVSVPLRHHLYSSTEFCYTCFTSIRMFNRMPHEWQRSHTTGLDKHNGKEGPAGLRLINNLEVLGKWYCASLWRRGCANSQRDYASGYIRGKSRIAAMLQQCVLQSRLRGHRVSHGLSLLDVSNAFPSPYTSEFTDGCVQRCSAT